MKVEQLIEEFKTIFTESSTGLIEKDAVSALVEFDADENLVVTFSHQDFSWTTKRHLPYFAESDYSNLLSREIESILAEAIGRILIYRIKIATI